MNKKNIFTFAILTLSLFISGGIVFAALEIPPDISLTIPGPHAESEGVPGLVANIYQFSLMIAVLLAFAMIVFAGAKYMFARGNPSEQSDARDGITQALLGLLLLAGASILLNIVNPRLTQLFLPTLDQIQAPPPAANLTSSAVETAARASLRQAGIGINQNPCPEGMTFQQFRQANSGRGCTNVGGLPASTVSNLIRLHNNCDCVVTITGGTELGHQTHGPGIPVVDLAFDVTLGNYLNAHREALGIRAVCTTNEDSHYRFNCGTVETERHLHVVFNP